jgi:hypothetical protein
VPLDRLSLSPQCVIVSFTSGNTVTENDECTNLKLGVDIARNVCKD